MDNPKIYSYFVDDWENKQHYHRMSKNYTKNMQWYKLYAREFLDDPKLMALTDEQKVFLMLGVWGIASQFKGRLPSSERIAFTIRRERDLKRIIEMLDHFEELGFINKYNANHDELLKEEIAFEKLMKLEGCTKEELYKKYSGKTSMNLKLREVFDTYFKDINLEEADIDDLLREKFVVDKETGEILNDTTTHKAHRSEFSKVLTTSDINNIWKRLNTPMQKELVKHAIRMEIKLPDNNEEFRLLGIEMENNGELDEFSELRGRTF